MPELTAGTTLLEVTDVRLTETPDRYDSCLRLDDDPGRPVLVTVPRVGPADSGRLLDSLNRATDVQLPRLDPVQA